MTAIKKRPVWFIVLFFAVHLIQPESGVAQVTDGLFTGATSEGGFFSFFVSEGQIIEFRYSYGFRLTPAPGENFRFSGNVSRDVLQFPISGNEISFTTSGTEPGSSTTTISGTFESPTAASGTGSTSVVSDELGLVTGSFAWTASRPAPPATGSGAVEDGLLAGLTSDNGRISVRVSGSEITEIVFQYPTTGSRDGIRHFRYSPPLAIAGGTFSRSVASACPSYTLNGSFASAASISGGGSVSFGRNLSGPCEIFGSSGFTWTATKVSPSNDNFSDALPIAGIRGTTTGDNVGASLEPVEPHYEFGYRLSNSTDDTSVWWKWTAPRNDNFIFDTSGSSFTLSRTSLLFTSRSTILAIYEGATIDGLTLVASGEEREASFDAVGGRTYYVQVTGLEGRSGDITLNWRHPEAPTLSSVEPARMTPGATITATLQGTGFIPGQTSASVSGDGVRVFPVNVSNSEALTATFTVDDAAALGARDLTVTTPDGTSNTKVLTIRGTVTSRSFTIGDRGASVVTTEGGSGLQTGSAVIGASLASVQPAGVAIFGLTQSGMRVSEAGVPASEPVSSGRIPVEFSGAVTTGIAIHNPSDAVTTFDFSFTDSTGAALGGGTATVPARGQIARFVNETPFNLTELSLGSMTFTASAPVAVVALPGLTNERSEFLITTLPVTSLNAPIGETVVLPHYADGGGWRTQVYLINPSDASVSGTVQFYDSATGQPTIVSIEGHDSTPSPDTFGFTIPAGSARRIRTLDQLSTIQSGSIRIVPDPANPSPGAVAVFSYRTQGITVSEAGVPPAPTGSAFRTYFGSSGDFLNGELGSYQPGIAVANLSDMAATVNFELTTVAGSATGFSGDLTIPAGGQTARFVNQIPGFEETPNSFEGVLRVASTASISIVALRGRYNERGDFLITTMPSSSEATPPVTDNLIFPHFVDGDGWTTDFVLFNATPNRSSAGTLQFFTQSGQPMGVAVQ